VYALNAETGTKLWSSATGLVNNSSPAVANGVVYVGSYYDRTVYALSAKTGGKLWSYITGGIVFSCAKLLTYTTGDIVDSSPVVARGWSMSDPTTTTCTRWTPAPTASYGATPRQRVYSSPAVANGVVYVSWDDGNVYATTTSTR
jgi:outer membrane protein assembly factor BamB